VNAPEERIPVAEVTDTVDGVLGPTVAADVERRPSARSKVGRKVQPSSRVTYTRPRILGACARPAQRTASFNPARAARERASAAQQVHHGAHNDPPRSAQRRAAEAPVVLPSQRDRSASGRQPTSRTGLRVQIGQEPGRVWPSSRGPQRCVQRLRVRGPALGSRAAAAPQQQSDPDPKLQTLRPSKGRLERGYHGCPSPIGNPRTPVRGVFYRTGRQGLMPGGEKRLLLPIMVRLVLQIVFHSEREEGAVKIAGRGWGRSYDSSESLATVSIGGSLGRRQSSAREFARY